MIAARHHTAGLLLLVAFSAAQQAQQEPNEAPAVMFHAQTRLVLLSFHVFHGKGYVTDLKPADIVLLEDGKPREFTIFDSPSAQGRMPLELVLFPFTAAPDKGCIASPARIPAPVCCRPPLADCLRLS
jgi:hypothetical protein